MRRFTLALITSSLLLAACSGASELNLDETEEVLPEPVTGEETDLPADDAAIEEAPEDVPL